MKKGGDASKYLKYIATRDGVQLSNNSFGNKEATQKQKDLIEKLLKDYPQSMKLQEYQDYVEKPTRQRASTLIEQVLDEHLNELISRGGYIDYIANRLRVERLGMHGLFSDNNQPIDLKQITDEVEKHQGNVWTHIISLKREDAERLGYNNANRWSTLIRSKRNEIASIMNIHSGHLRWFGAYHDEGHHPHIHLVIYSTDPHEGYLKKEGIDQLRSTLAKDIFRFELLNLYKEQTQVRDDLKLKTHEQVKELLSTIEESHYYDEMLYSQIIELKGILDQTSGKLQYGYLNKETKDKVDRIVERISMFSEIDALYSIWKEKRESIHQTYQDKYKEHLPLHLQKEFKSIKNMIIKEIAEFKVSSQKDSFSESDERQVVSKKIEFSENQFENHEPIKNMYDDVLFLFDEKKEKNAQHHTKSDESVQSEVVNQYDGPLLITRLLHHTSRALTDQIEQRMNQLTQSTDSKLRMKIKLKKQLQGHQWDDHS